MVKPILVSIVALDGRGESELLELAAGAANSLEPPLRTAILESARERNVEVAAAGHAVILGNAALFSELGLSVARLGNWPEKLQQRGQQVLFVAVDGQAAGFLGMIDDTG